MDNFTKVFVPLIFILALTAPQRAESQFTFELASINQISFVEPVEIPNSNLAEVNFMYFNAPGSDDKFLNMVGEDPDNPGDLHWIVKNIALEPLPDTMHHSYWIDLTNLGYEELTEMTEVHVSTHISDEMWESMPPEPMPPSSMPVGTHNFFVAGNDIANNELPELPDTVLGPLPETSWERDSVTRGVNRGCNIPNIDLDSDTHNPFDPDPFIPGYAGDHDACGPAATANSFAWLGEQHPDEIGSVLDDNFDTDENALRRMMAEFSDLMGRDPNGGVQIVSFIEAKLAFIDQYQLPMHVKFQSVGPNIKDEDSIESPNPEYGHAARNENADPPDGDYGYITREWMYEEMERGEDVELFIVCLERNEDDSPGEVATLNHYITLSGIRQNGENWRARYKDDQDQSQEGGTRNPIVTLEKDTTFAPGIILIPEISRNHNMGYCFIKDVVSESYDSSVTFNSVMPFNTPEHKYNINIYPNPVSGFSDLNVEFDLNIPETVSVVLRDISGRTIKVLKQPGQANQGTNELSYQLDRGAGLREAQGIYLLELNIGNVKHVEKVMIY